MLRLHSRKLQKVFASISSKTKTWLDFRGILQIIKEKPQDKARTWPITWLLSRHGPGSGRALWKELTGRYVKGFTHGHLLPPARITSNASKLISSCTMPTSIFQGDWQVFLQKKVSILTMIKFTHFYLHINLFICTEEVSRYDNMVSFLYVYYICPYFYLKRNSKLTPEEQDWSPDLSASYI